MIISVKNVHETSLQTATPELIYVSDSCPIIETRGSVLPVEPPKVSRHDRYYGQVEMKIPDPTIRTAFIGE